MDAAGAGQEATLTGSRDSTAPGPGAGSSPGGPSALVRPGPYPLSVPRSPGNRGRGPRELIAQGLPLSPRGLSPVHGGQAGGGWQRAGGGRVPRPWFTGTPGLLSLSRRVPVCTCPSVCACTWPCSPFCTQRRPLQGGAGSSWGAGGAAEVEARGPRWAGRGRSAPGRAAPRLRVQPPRKSCKCCHPVARWGQCGRRRRPPMGVRRLGVRSQVTEQCAPVLPSGHWILGTAPCSDCSSWDPE